PDSMVGHYTNEWISKNGSRHLIEWVNTLLLDESGQMEFMVALGNDITKRNEAEKYIQEQARLLDIIFQYSLDSLVILDKDYNFIRVTETYAKACQRDSSSFPGLNHFELYPSDFEQEHAEYKKNKIIYSKNARPFIFPDHPEWGTTYWDLAMVPILDATGEIEMFVFTLKNVTEEKNNALNLEKSLQEKEILLKEVHHRVKNNLQIISSLLFLQSQKITDPDHLELFRESQNRVSTMALIHEQLYQTNNFAEVNFDRYTKNLIESLFQTYGIDKSLISHSIQTSNILLDINLAITCGLVLNEIVSNSLKYAFAERKSGKIQIHLTKDNRILHLQVSDNGIGFPEGFQKENSTSLGLKLIDRMVNQLQGKLNQNSSKEGVEYSIQFPESGYESIVNTSQNAGFIGR
ncbi:MAG: ATP-binding protein, partial [Spirochaetia bacterium]|nr:ATP-binding protein [Spirochaetia bacterium]